MKSWWSLGSCGSGINEKSMTVNLTRNAQEWQFKQTNSTTKQREKVRLLKTDTTILKEDRGIKQNTNTLLQAPRVKEIDAR